MILYLLLSLQMILHKVCLHIAHDQGKMLMAELSPSFSITSDDDDIPFPTRKYVLHLSIFGK